MMLPLCAMIHVSSHPNTDTRSFFMPFIQSSTSKTFLLSHCVYFATCILRPHCHTCFYSSLSIGCSCTIPSCGLLFLPAATKLWPRLCFYSCLWFCLQGGSPCMETPPGRRHPPNKETPPKEAPPWQGDPPRERHPPAGRPPKWGTPQQGDPPGRRHPPRKETPRRSPPPQKEPPGRRPPAGRPPREGAPPPAYGQWAAGTHPTGMHSCNDYFFEHRVKWPYKTGTAGETKL